MDLLMIDVVGPEPTKLSSTGQHMSAVAQWWENVKLYAEAMRSLDRVVMIRFDDDAREWYVSSVPQVIDP